MNALALRPRTVGEILDAGIKLYLRNARTLIGAAAVVVVPAQIVIGIVLLSTVPSGSDVPGTVFTVGHTTTGSSGARSGGEVVTTLLGLVVTLLVTAACVRAVSDAYLDQTPSVASSLRFVVRRLPALIVMYILQVLGLLVGFILLIIPGIWLYAAWAVITPAMMIEGLGPVRSLGRSRRLVRGRWWPTAGVVLVSTILNGIVADAIRALLTGLDGFSSHPGLVAAVLATTLGGIIASIITQPFVAAVITVLYYDLRVRKEGYDLELLADQLGVPVTALPDGPAGDWQPGDWPTGPESVGQPGGPPFWPPPPGWTPGS